MPWVSKTRVDQRLVTLGLAPTRAKAQALVLAGTVYLGDQRVDKSGTLVDEEAPLTVRGSANPYVSRGGLKLAGALETFRLDVTGRRCLDLGASTGGFTDCLLAMGAARVIALDVGKGQLHWKLRRDTRVTVLEGRNARELSSEDLPYQPGLATIDVSFISLEKVIEPVIACLKTGAEVLALVKPQFEAGLGMAPKGVVRDPATHLEVLLGLKRWLEEKDLVMEAVTPSRIRGPKGNVEFFVKVSRGRAATEEDLAGAVEKAKQEA